MLFSIALILLSGFIIGIILEKIKIPRLVGFIIVGLIIGPYALNLIDPKMLSISSELRQIALIIILTRAGLSLDLSSLKKIGRPAILMSFVPASFEIIGTTTFGPIFLGISTFEALLLGSVLAAVSPAVVVPRMIKLQKDGYGRKHNIPELLLAGSSVDDVYVIVLFYAFLGLVENNAFDLTTITMIPVSIVLGVLLGVIVGFILSFTYKKTNYSLTIKVLITLSSSFLMIALENLIKDYLSISSLLGIMTLGLILLSRNKQDAIELEEGYHKLWVFFEIFLFVLVGASVDINYAITSGINSVLLLLTAIAFRILGVFICLIGTKMNRKEKVFIAIAYLPKATVQASIGGIALSMGLAIGSMVLTIAVLSILITAPIGAILIDNTFKKLLALDIDK